MPNPPDRRGSAPAPTTDCCLFRPGHRVHWIQVHRSVSDPGHRPQPGRLLSVRPDGLVVVEVEGEVRRLWNHQPDRLAALVAANDGAVTHQPRRGLLRTPGPGCTHCFCVARAGDPERTACTAAVEGDTAVARLLASGGATLTDADFLAAVDELGGTGSGGS